ncbi:MotA/TolQ/ExbB proton channel family protein [Sedimenticola selenatireducens]|uniref:MotA/TolQ/ExbB proton channel family protein n=1 Tax=Sedimenticola selenatireducens TaxID=191960 RepID=A0A557S556_9GAMM|nr:MotA/TolQ/ExbB proton channel family protein [Sedimenticola selenatireducens]TVO72549.1 MotA/TolQ/ExbB proton channel family protein [Sedimenticola selenatireducens]TVT64803.1 MAG: MotA/TolQ/ExbB proton channel family protein [Sedimenticola selenatireducens]
MNMEELITKGGPVVWILVGYSAIGVAIVIERSLLFLRQRRLPTQIVKGLGSLLDHPKVLTESGMVQGPEYRIVDAIVTADAEGVKDLRSVGDRVRSHELQRMEFGLRTLGILGNTAPLLGLLGTITGMIKAFMVIEQAGGKVDAQALAGGIWEAMITTGVGLAVAIPLLILLHFLEGAVERRNQSMNTCIALLLERRGNGRLSEVNQDQPHHWEQITDGV